MIVILWENSWQRRRYSGRRRFRSTDYGFQHMVDNVSQKFELFSIHRTSCSETTTEPVITTMQEPKSAFDYLHRDCFQNIVDHLSLIEGFALLSNVSKRYQAFRPFVTLSSFIESEKKIFLKKVLNKEILRYAITDFGFVDNLKPNCANISRLAYNFNELSPIVGTDELSDIIVTPIANQSDFVFASLKKIVKPKNIRSAKLVHMTQKISGIWVIAYAFHCQNSRLNCMGYICRDKRPCKFSYSIQKCSSSDCNQPFFACPGCRIGCYDCDQGGLCTSCLFETPNSGEIVYACAPCRGFSIWLSLWPNCYSRNTYLTFITCCTALSHSKTSGKSSIFIPMLTYSLLGSVNLINGDLYNLSQQQVSVKEISCLLYYWKKSGISGISLIAALSLRYEMKF